MEHPLRTLLYDLFVAGFVNFLWRLFGRKPSPLLQKSDRE
jgi:hypothetical protein